MAHVESVSKSTVVRDPTAPSESKNRLTSQVCTAREDMLKAHGEFTLAYSAHHQDGLQHFGDHRGYVAYAQKMGYTFVLGDPVGPEEVAASLLTDFVATFPNSAFVQVCRNTANTLHGLGYRINGMGVDTCLELSDYSFYGKTKERYRYAQNWLNRRGYRFFESTLQNVGESNVEEISRQWRKTRTIRNREVQFLNRPLTLEHQTDTRHFFLTNDEGQLMVYIGLDPVYRHGRVIGYSTAFKRRHPDAPSNGEQGLMKMLVDQLKAECFEVLWLGLSPLAGVENHDLRINPLLKWSWGYGFRAWWVNRYFYNLQGHADYKRRFLGREVQTYFAAQGLIQDMRLFALLRLCRIL